MAISSVRNGAKLTIKYPDWCKPILDRNEEVRYIGLYGGRGSGKSEFTARHIVLECLTKPLNVCCLRETQKSIDYSSKRIIESVISEYGLTDMFKIKKYEIENPFGGHIIFAGLRDHTADTIKSLYGIDIFWFEEAEKCSRYSFEILRPTLRKKGGYFIFTWNPENPDAPVDSFFRRERVESGDTLSINLSYRDNPWFEADGGGLRREMEWLRAHDLERYLHVWEGGYYSRSEARVFSNWSVEEFDAPSDAVFRFGADWGYTKDPTVLVRCYVDGPEKKDLYIDNEVYAFNVETDMIRDHFMQIDGAERWPIYGDSSKPDTISYLRRHGFPKLVGAPKPPGSVEAGIRFLQSHRMHIHPRCKNTINELQHYNFKVDKLTGLVTSTLEDKNNHVIDALRYANDAARRLDSARPEPLRYATIQSPFS